MKVSSASPNGVLPLSRASSAVIGAGESVSNEHRLCERVRSEQAQLLLSAKGAGAERCKDGKREKEGRRFFVFSFRDSGKKILSFGKLKVRKLSKVFESLHQLSGVYLCLAGPGAA